MNACVIKRGCCSAPNLKFSVEYLHTTVLLKVLKYNTLLFVAGIVTVMDSKHGLMVSNLTYSWHSKHFVVAPNFCGLHKDFGTIFIHISIVIT